MEPAAVGFQCPECVREGHRTTRQAQSRYGGARSTNPALTTMVIIGINVVVWLTVLVTGSSKSRLLDWFMLMPTGKCLSQSSPGQYYAAVESERVCTIALGGDGLWAPGVADGALWQVMTSAFTHLEIWHIGFNMMALWFLGPQVEAVIGRARFIALYLVSALSGSAAVLWLGSEHGSTLGASGAIWGLLGALLVLVWKAGGDLRSVLTWVGINLVLTFAFPGISWQAHIGGLVAGALITAVIVLSPPGPRRTTTQWSGIAGVGALVAVAILVRALMLG